MRAAMAYENLKDALVANKTPSHCGTLLGAEGLYARAVADGRAIAILVLRVLS